MRGLKVVAYTGVPEITILVLRRSRRHGRGCAIPGLREPETIPSWIPARSAARVDYRAIGTSIRADDGSNGAATSIAVIVMRSTLRM